METAPPSNQPASQPQQPGTAPAAPKSKKAMVGVYVAVAVVATAVVGKMIAQNSSSTSTNQQAGGTKHGSYKDGTYTADGSYMTHAGPESVTIGITLKGNTITDTTFAATPAAGMSKRFQDMFSQGYKALVVGKNIDDVNLGIVSGSSLTPIGFNDALTKIKAQASS